MHKSLLWIMTAVPLLGCGAPDVDKNDGPSDAQYIALAHQNVRALLKDPESARFEDVFVSKKAGVAAVCGYVNSRNSFGGMSGRQRFISGGVTQLEENFAPGEMDQAWSMLCR